MNPSRMSRIAVASLALFVCTHSSANPKETYRYPFDPVCAWGRLSDGRGLVVRCLTREEAERLMKAPAPTSTTQPGAEAATSAGQATPVAASPTPTTPAGASPAAPAASSPVSGNGAAGSPAPTVASPDSFVAELLSVTADDGELRLAKKKLAVPVDRYAQCVADHGGLTAATGQVEVEFLVRERGRAEGANAAKYQGMSEAAANCIAQVVDRRPTGAPEAPLVSAKATIRVRKKAAR